jgi:AraC-like DNA-binding protein
VGSARIAAFLHLPDILRDFGIDVAEVIKEAGVRADIFSDPENLISYPDVGRLLAVSVRRSHCDHISLLVGQRSRLASMGLAGQVVLCAATVGEGLRNLARFFSLHNTAAIVSVVTADGYTRLAYAIATPAMGDTGQIQLGAMALAFNIMQDLCGPEWLPSSVLVASSAPANLRPSQKFFRAPLRFDSDETALVFESHWLDRAIPPMEPSRRRQVEAEIRARELAILADFPMVVRRVLRKQLMTDRCSMGSVAALVGLHPRTLDRRLKQHGTHYREVLDSVKHEVACQLLRDTRMQMQEIAGSLRYRSAANFTTAFRRWAGVSPRTYRRSAH